MGRSDGVTISVKIPIHWDIMTKIKQQRLRQIVGRDTRIIRAYLGVIEQHEKALLTGRNKTRIHSSRLNELTLTALKVKEGTSKRFSVEHDFKERFPRISVNELQECRITAVGMYESYLQLRRKSWRKVSLPSMVTRSRRIPRWAYSQRFSMVKDENSSNRWWLDLRNSLDSAPAKKSAHDRLRIPLKLSPFHLSQLSRGELKAIQVFTDARGKWWITVAVRIGNDSTGCDTSLPPAVLGIDLGINKAICATLLTPEKVRETRYFVYHDKVKLLSKYELMIADLQSEMMTRKNQGVSYVNIASKLKKLRTKRGDVAKEYDRAIISQLIEYIGNLSEKYSLYVGIGRLKYIRRIARKKPGVSKNLRRKIHSWAFARFTNTIMHQLSQLGWTVSGTESRFRVIPESWTSILCWKCGRKGIRPKQNLFVCPTCGNKCNADMNGAINIAGRFLTLTSTLHGVGGRGKWMDAIQRAKNPRPKARGKKSRGKSLLSKGDSSSESGESAAVHFAQSSLTSFSDGVGRSDHDPAVGKAIATLSDIDSDESIPSQKKEARSLGEVAPQ